MDSIPSILSTRRCIDFRSEFNDETLFLTPEILAACCIMNGKGASSNNLSSSAEIIEDIKVNRFQQILARRIFRYKKGKKVILKNLDSQ